jgi:hypothetical protein
MFPTWHDLLLSLTAIAVSVVWLFNQLHEYKNMKAFIVKLGSNHLPHIYNSLQKIELRLGIPPEEIPVIGFIEKD